MGEWKSLKMDSGTGWKDIYREAGTGWKALEWEGVPIDVGGACITRANVLSGAYTGIDLTNPANASGNITDVCVYMHAVVATDTSIGIFYFVSGTTYKCRSAGNLGQLSVGENNIGSLSLAIVTGDFIGFCGNTNSNTIKRSATGGSGVRYAAGNKCVVDDESTYALMGDDLLSLYGTG